MLLASLAAAPASAATSTTTPPTTTFTIPTTLSTSTTLAAPSTVASTSTTTLTVPSTTLPCTSNADCDDGVYCNGQERCRPTAGCVPGRTRDVDDGIECTLDRCDEEENHIVHEPDALICADDNECTDDACDIDEGCLNVPNQEPCDDAVACTIEDQCSAGRCAGTSNCPDDEVCELETGSCKEGREGDVNDDGSITAGDALSALRVAIGAGSCGLEICDVDHNGTITAADALLILVEAVGAASS